MTTILLVDDHHVMRQGLRSLLEAETDFQVVGDAADGEEALALAQRLRPDVVVLDMLMPGMNGVEITERLRKTIPATAVVILSMFGSEGYVHKAMRAGAKGYVLKQATAEELAHAIRQVVTGRRYLSQTLSERAIDTYVQQRLSSNLDPFLVLTNREREVLRMIGSGDANKQIAAKLNISPRTVEFHRANLKRKLGLHNQQELLRYCIRSGILLESAL